MVSARTVATELLKFSVLYQPRKSPDEMQLLCQEWQEVLPEGMTDVQFMAASREVKARAKFFPVPSDVIDVWNKAVSRPDPQVQRQGLPYRGTEAHKAQCEKNAANARKIREMLEKISKGKK